MSACSARMSTTLPLPSSPHWTPTPTTAGMSSSARRLYARRRSRVDRSSYDHSADTMFGSCAGGPARRRNALVDVHQRRAPCRRRCFAAELQAGDVDLGLAEQHADGADDARHVAVVQHQDEPFRHRLQIEAVDLHQADHVASEDGARRLRSSSAAVRTRTRDEIGEALGRRAARLDDLDAALARDSRALTKLTDAGLEQTVRAGPCSTATVTGCTSRAATSPAYSTVTSCRRPLEQLRLQAAEALAEVRYGPQHLELLGAQRRHVHGVASDVVTPGNATICSAIATETRDLRLRGRGAEMRRADHLVELEQRMIGRRRLLLEDVERGAGKASARAARRRARLRRRCRRARS